jgi:hypothetical protein
MRNLIKATTVIAWALWLGGCGMPLVQSYHATVPTPAGNGTVRTTSVGGLYQSTDIENPEGIDRACIDAHRRWNDYLTEQQARSTPTIFSAWVEAYRQIYHIAVVARCTNFATHGDRLDGSNGAGAGTGVGVAPFSGNRVFKAGGR